MRAGRVLLWRRSDNICFALLLGSGEGVTVGEAVECQVQGILQAGLHALCLRCGLAAATSACAMSPHISLQWAWIPGANSWRPRVT